MKRLTKAQREERERAELGRIVRAVYAGATAGESLRDREIPGATELARIMPALKAFFGPQQPGKEYPWSLGHLYHFDASASATEALYSWGFRA